MEPRSDVPTGELADRHRRRCAQGVLGWPAAGWADPVLVLQHGRTAYDSTGNSTLGRYTGTFQGRLDPHLVPGCLARSDTEGVARFRMVGVVFGSLVAFFAGQKRMAAGQRRRFSLLSATIPLCCLHEAIQAVHPSTRESNADTEMRMSPRVPVRFRL